MQIIPTILEKDYITAHEKIRRVKDELKWIQVDVIDDCFRPGKTFELELLTRIELNLDNNLWEIHLMVKEPIKWIEKCNFVGATRIIGQVELMNNLEEEYDIIASTHSAFSKNHADSFEANEVKNLGECNISLPEWSLAGDGYTVSIQKKAI